MMAAERVSPEERLFKVIQDGKNAPPRKAAPPRRPVALALALPVSLRAKELNAINRLMVFLLIIVIAAASYYLLSTKPDISGIIREASLKPFKGREREAPELFKPVALYLDAADKRDILRPAPRPAEELVVVEEKPPEKKLAELAGALKLQGISWGAFPKAIIQDGSDGQVYFTRKGQTVGPTEVEVREITKDKVVLGYGDEEMELL